MDTDVDSIMKDPSILELEDPLEQNNVKDTYSDGNIHTAVVPADDNSLKQNNETKMPIIISGNRIIILMVISLLRRLILILLLLLPPIILTMDEIAP